MKLWGGDPGPHHVYIPGIDLGCRYVKNLLHRVKNKNSVEKKNTKRVLS